MKVGDRVKWESQGGGSYTTKEGVIVRVITKDENPVCWRIAFEEFPTHIRKFDGWDMPGGKSTKEAYLVEVVVGQTIKPRLYMPLPGKLIKIKEKS